MQRGRGADQIGNIHWITQRAKEFQENIYFIDYAKAFVWITANWKEMGIPDYLTCLLKNLYAGQNATLESNMEKQTGSNLGKYKVAVYRHSAYSTYMHSTSSKMPGQMKLKLALRLPGEISITLDMQMPP